jgi:DNA-directed RNA polymerase specialized sigma24 family protein
VTRRRLFFAGSPRYDDSVFAQAENRFMSDADSSNRLSRIKTRWTTFAQAHFGGGDEAAAAQQRLLLLYYRAVYYYLRGMVHDSDVAEELTHDFSVRFLRGDFRRARRQRGRFRDLVKTAARNLALDYWKREARRKKKGPRPLPQYLLTPETEAVFIRAWRQTLLSEAWKALARLERQTGSPYYTLLRYRSTHPRVHSSDLARHLAARLGRVFTAPSIRQTLSRAREKFADCLVQHVVSSLSSAEPAAVAHELSELNLLAYCKEALQRMQKRTPRLSSTSRSRRVKE